MNTSHKSLLVLSSIAIVALATGGLLYFNIDTPDPSNPISTRNRNQSKTDKTEEEEFLPKGGDPLAQATDKFYFHSFKPNPQLTTQLTAQLKADGATPEEIKKIEKFPLGMIETAEGLFAGRLVVYLKDGTKWSHSQSK